ncbi:2-hydroxyacid dehydrogenase [Bacillus litorisediminis]|uniref:2-hydroxyacid dehydrogenase n=1 Tax=Bacillus litorisediminis TaxID=2922713 RepID=UPI001FAD79C4|nr:D-glycerate dehydrogenase [Bacillus litorisediminis]
MNRQKIVITRKIPESYVNDLKKQFEVVMWSSEDQPVTREYLLNEVKDASAILSMLTDTIDRELLSQGSELKVVANMAVGYDNIDVQAARDLGITVCNTPDILSDTTADLAFALMMATARRIVEAAEMVKQGKWLSWSPYFLAGYEIHHKTIGIVGMGKIGEAIAKRATGFDMNILYYNRSRKPDAEQRLGAVYADLDTLLQESDFIVCMIPLTAQTKGLFGEKEFKKMKRTAIFINAARGAVVDESALIAALEAGEIAGAGLDVFEKEPIDANHPLLQFPNVVALPHIGSATHETRSAMIALCCENITRVLRGERPKTEVKS